MHADAQCIQTVYTNVKHVKYKEGRQCKCKNNELIIMTVIY